MRLVVFGATGGIGREVVKQALADGHQVVVVVRDAARAPEGAERVVAELRPENAERLVAALSGADAVLSGLGPRPGQNRAIAYEGTEVILAAMRKAGVSRFVAVSAAPIGTMRVPGLPKPPRRDPGDTWLTAHVAMPIFKTILKKHFVALARMEQVIRQSGLDWTIARPPRLTDGPLTRRYRTALDRNVPQMLVSRADCAHAMLAALDRPETIGHTLGVAG